MASVSRTAQAVEPDLNEFEGRTPVELIGGTTFPRIGQLSYMLTLPPFGFYWFQLSTEAEAPPWSIARAGPGLELLTFVVREGLVLEGAVRLSLE